MNDSPSEPLNEKSAEAESAVVAEAQAPEPVQTDAPTLAVVAGEAVSELPTDLYIPPDALEVFLETFEGPLDLLLYLIRRENLDILEVQVAEITAQYMGYIEVMEALKLELAAEYLLMAATLAEIKSRMLLPRPAHAEEDEEDPRAELIRRLQRYEQFKTAAEQIEELPRLERDIYLAHAAKPELVREHADPDVDLKEVLVALAQVLRRADMYQHHAVQLEPLSVRERMSNVLERVSARREFVPFAALFTAEEGRQGVIVTFLALMELVREALVEFQQNEPFGPIYLRAAGESQER
jgi:segregation and condensation protein A